jgi:hypothetical protein
LKVNYTDHNHRTIDRRGLLELLATIVGGLGLVSTLPLSARAEENSSEDEVAIDDSYLVKGLTGMARAKGWFDAHWGAGILAGYYLCQDNSLGNATTAAIKNQLDAVIQKHGEQFLPFTEERSDKARIEEVPRALRVAIDGGLRAHGHAVIFASLSIRALRDVPQMAQPKIIQALCGLSHQIAKGKPQTPLDPAFVYPDSKTMIEATLDSLVKFKDLLGRPSIRRPNFTHMVTHTEALLNLELMGYSDLAKMGHAGQKTHISSAVPAFEASEAEKYTAPSLLTLTQPEFWNDMKNQERWSQKWNQEDNPNGDWIASGHLFKVLYSYHRLITRVPDREDIELCSSILLERYVNPDVQGG